MHIKNIIEFTFNGIIECERVGQAEGGEPQTKHKAGELGRSHIMGGLVAPKKSEFSKGYGNPLKTFYTFKE